MPIKRMTAILAGPSVSDDLARHYVEAERVVAFTACEQPGVGGNYRSPKREHQAAVEIELERLAVRFTRRVRYDNSLKISLNY
jgi:hypothetical protein